MSFQQGLSGLNAASKSLESIGNNVANANTVGFKESEVQFADVYAASLTGAGGMETGIGTKVAAITQQFTQGNISASDNPLDVAINGGGFFRMSNNGTISYARNGQFQLDKDGFIVNSSGARLTGYVADSRGILSTGAPADLNINTADLAPQATDKIKAQMNLDSRVPAIDQTKTPFDISDPLTYNNASSVSVYDSLGNAHVMQTFYVKTGPLAPATTAPTWNVYAAFDGVEITQLAADEAAGAVPPAHAAAVTPQPVGTLVFDQSGALDKTAMAALATPTTMPVAVKLPVYPSTGSGDPLTVHVDFTGSTQYGSSFGVSSLTQDGYASGKLSGFNIGDDGTIVGRYTNGKSATLGQVVLANFTNPNGLQPLGNNMWSETASSGQALVGAPGSGGVGTLKSSAVEDSNVDLTAELVNMITAQRVYQANAQTIKTQDQVLQTLVNLR